MTEMGAASFEDVTAIVRSGLKYRAMFNASSLLMLVRSAQWSRRLPFLKALVGRFSLVEVTIVETVCDDRCLGIDV
jgi:hypothetical protein